MTRFQKTCLAGASLISILCGCRSAPPNRLELVDYRAEEPQAQHFEDFDEALYRVTDDGRADIVLRKKVSALSRPAEDIVQVVRVQTIWKATPGRTYAESSMINANICYVLMRGSACTSYEGGGFIQYRFDRKKRQVSGVLEGGTLRPLRRAGRSLDVFDRVHVEGRFKARHDERRATRIINDLERLLGPRPTIDPPHRGPDY